MENVFIHYCKKKEKKIYESMFDLVSIRNVYSKHQLTIYIRDATKIFMPKIVKNWLKKKIKRKED